MIEITLLGHVPSKKNSKRLIFRRRRRPLVLPSANYQAWEKEQLKLLRRMRIRPVQPPFSLSIWLFPANRRINDLSNKFESIADLLVLAKVLPEDHWFFLTETHAYFGEIDPVRPRVEIKIKELQA